MKPGEISVSSFPMEECPGKSIQLRAQLVNPRNEERDAEWPTHHRILVVHTLSEPQGKVTNGLSDTFHLDLLVVGEGMVLGRDSRVVNHGTGIGGEAGHGAAEVAVYLHDFLDGGRLEERGLDALLDAEDDAFGCTDADGC